MTRNKVILILFSSLYVLLMGFGVFQFPGFMNTLDPEKIRAEFKFVPEGELKMDENLEIVHGQLSKDGLRFYVSVWDKEKQRTLIGKLERKSLDEPFGTFTPLEGQINNPRYNAILATVTEDENFIVFVNVREYTHKTLKDLYLAEKHPNTGKYDRIRYLKELNSESISENYPWISADGLRIFFAKEINGEYHWFWASRKSTAEPFKRFKHVQVMGTNMSANSCLTLVNEEKEIFALSGKSIYYSRRPAPWEYFPPLIELVKLDVDGDIEGFTLSDDKKELYLFVNREGKHQVVAYKNQLQATQQNQTDN